MKFFTSIVIASLMVATSTNIQAAPASTGGYSVVLKSNPDFKPIAKRQVFKAMRKFSRLEPNRAGRIDLGIIPFTDVSRVGGNQLRDSAFICHRL